ncbi:MAG: MBL fold metallo-hydrolase [Lachnospiraceae bacterium]|nr:MBL fold metallo-hydrolase [Lachnospiraceae bacterium]
MKMMSIASGSSGNCTFVGTENTSLLVDVGISKKKISEGLSNINLDFTDINGILITHEHIDHIRAIGVIARAYGIPIYSTKDTCHEICKCKSLGNFDNSLLNPIEPDSKFTIGDIDIVPHSIWHDAADPLCYTLFNNGKKISIATDIGNYDQYLINGLKDSDALLIESNHDLRMLQVGPYPYDLKRRVMSDRGHLSNEASGKLIKSILNDHIKAILLGHLSHENNYPELAYETVKLEISDNPYTSDVRDFNLQVASRDICSELVLV